MRPNLKLNNNLTAARMGILGLLICLSASVSRGAGPAFSVQTRDGKTYEGSLQFQSPDVLIVTPGNGAPVSVPAAGLLQLSAKLSPRLIELPATLPANEPDKTASVPSTAPSTAPFPSPDNNSWRTQDIGHCLFPGSAVVKDGTLTVQASGWGLWGPEDSFRFVYLPLNGSGQIIAHVVSMEDDKGTMICGLSFRESLDPAAKHFSGLADPYGTVRSRSRPNGYAAPFSPGKQGPLKFWLRVARSGDQFEIYKSDDGHSWVTAGRLVMPMSPNAYVGVAVSTRVNSYVETAVFDHVAVMPGVADVTCFPGSDAPSSGVVLRDGTVFEGEVNSLDKTQLHFLHGDLRRNRHGNYNNEPEQFSIPIANVSAILFHTAPADYIAQLDQPAAPAVLLQNGDQLEGNVDEVGQGTVTINSVVVGLKKLSERTDCVAARLSQLALPAGSWMIRTADGSRFYVSALKFDKGMALVNHPLFGQRKLEPGEIAEIKAGQ